MDSDESWGELTFLIVCLFVLFFREKICASKQATASFADKEIFLP